jgi:hypothetical protein
MDGVSTKVYPNEIKSELLYGPTIYVQAFALLKGLVLLLVLSYIVLWAIPYAKTAAAWVIMKASSKLSWLPAMPEGMTPGETNIGDAKVGMNSWAAGGGSAAAEGSETNFADQRTPTLSGNTPPAAGASCPEWSQGAKDEMDALATVGAFKEHEMVAALAGK